MIHFAYPSLSKGLLVLRSMVCFSNSQRLLRQARTPHRSINPVTASYGYLLNPQPAAPGQDALGLITIYPRPDEPISNPLQPYQPQSLFSHHLSIRPLSKLQRHSQPISIHDHRTILNRRSQYIQKINRITVYPFTQSVTGKPLYTRFGGYDSFTYPPNL